MATFHTRHAKGTVVQVCAPTEVANDSEKYEFYDQLQGVIDEIPSFDIKLVMGDFNAKLALKMDTIHHRTSWLSRRHRDCCRSAACSGLSIGNTFSKHKRIHTQTWTSPEGNTSNEIDYDTYQ